MTGPEIALEPCPFCARPLTRGSRKINPNARCTTEECYGAKMPVVNLDVPASVEAWNTRAPASPSDEQVEFALTDIAANSDDPIAVAAACRALGHSEVDIAPLTEAANQKRAALTEHPARGAL